VYGVLTYPLHRRLPFAVAVAAFAAFSLAMFGAARLKAAVANRGRAPETRTSGESVSSNFRP
jgi:hypothetical protein